MGPDRRWILPAAFAQLEKKAARLLERYFGDRREVEDDGGHVGMGLGDVDAVGTRTSSEVEHAGAAGEVDDRRPAGYLDHARRANGGDGVAAYEEVGRLEDRAVAGDDAGVREQRGDAVGSGRSPLGADRRH